MDLDRRLEVVERENDVLRERVRQLETALAGDLQRLPIEWRLTESETVIVGVLLQREVARKDVLMTALYSGLVGEMPDPKIVDVYVHKARRKLKPFGITIETHWGVGYGLTPESRQKLGDLAK